MDVLFKFHSISASNSRSAVRLGGVRIASDDQMIQCATILMWRDPHIMTWGHITPAKYYRHGACIHGSNEANSNTSKEYYYSLLNKIARFLCHQLWCYRLYDNWIEFGNKVIHSFIHSIGNIPKTKLVISNIFLDILLIISFRPVKCMYL